MRVCPCVHTTPSPLAPVCRLICLLPVLHRLQAGTPYWTAPEVLRGETYNEKADVFSFAM